MEIALRDGDNVRFTLQVHEKSGPEFAGYDWTLEDSFWHETTKKSKVEGLSLSLSSFLSLLENRVWKFLTYFRHGHETFARLPANNFSRVGDRAIGLFVGWSQLQGVVAKIFAFEVKRSGGNSAE